MRKFIIMFVTKLQRFIYSWFCLRMQKSPIATYRCKWTYLQTRRDALEGVPYSNGYPHCLKNHNFCSPALWGGFIFTSSHGAYIHTLSIKWSSLSNFNRFMAIILLYALNNGKMLHKTETPILKFALSICESLIFVLYAEMHLCYAYIPGIT